MKTPDEVMHADVSPSLAELHTAVKVLEWCAGQIKIDIVSMLTKTKQQIAILSKSGDGK